MFQVQQSELKDALQAIKPATSSKSHETVNYIKLVFDNNSKMLDITAFDLQIAIKSSLLTYFDDETADKTFVVKFDQFNPIIDKLDGYLTFNISVDKIQITSETGADFTFVTLDPEVLSSLPAEYIGLMTSEIEPEFEISLPPIKLLQLAASVASPEISKQVLTTINFQPGAIAATDAHRLVEITHESFDDISKQFLVPRDFILALNAKKFANGGTLSVQGNTVCIKDAEEMTSLATFLPSFNYPNYKALLPAKFAHETEINSGLMLKNVQIASLVSTDSRLYLTFNGSNITVSAESQEGDCKLPMTSFSEISQETKFAFSADYLVSLLTPIKSGSTSLHINQPSQPVIFKSTLEEDYSVTSLIMPVIVRS